MVYMKLIGGENLVCTNLDLTDFNANWLAAMAGSQLLDFEEETRGTVHVAPSAIAYTREVS